MKKKLISLISFCTLTVPLFVLADTTPKLDGYLKDLITQATGLLKYLLTFLIALAVVWFIWNVVRYSMSEDEGGKAKAKDQMIHGIIAIAVIVSIWGLVSLLQTAFIGGNAGTAPSTLDSMIPSANI